MQELIPLAAGGLVGLLVSQLRVTWLKVAIFVALCLVIGFLVSFFTGELEISEGFLSIDAGLVWLGGLITVSLVEGWRYLQSRQTSTQG